MRTLLAFVTALSVTVAVPALASVVAPSMADLGTAVAARRQTVLAESESSGPTRFGRDTAQLAEASLPSPGSRDTAV